MNKFAERLKGLRQEKGLSIQALAKDVKGSQLIVLAEYFDVTIDFLMGLED